MFEQQTIFSVTLFHQFKIQEQLMFNASRHIFLTLSQENL